MAELKIGNLLAWMDREDLTHDDLARVLGLKRPTVTAKLLKTSKFYADQLCKIISLFESKLGRREFAEFLREVVGIDLEATSARDDGPTPEHVEALRQALKATRELAEHKDRIRELENALAALRLRHRADRRRDDPPEVNPAELRRPLEPGNAQDRH